MRGWLLRRRLRRLSWEELLAAGYAWKVTDDCKLELVSLKPGTPPDGGYLKPSASTGTKEPGTQRQATAIGADFSSCFRPGALSGAPSVRIERPHVNSSTVRGSFTTATATRGGNGAPPESVV